MISRLLADIDCRMPAGHIYRSSRIVNWAHETTHGLHSRIRNRISGPRTNACYVGGGRAVTLREPRCRLSDVAQRVPRHLRGGVYSLYLVQQQRYWQNEPLYVLDEWVSYTNGAEVAVEAAEAGRRLANETSTTTFMLEFNSYAMTLLGTVRAVDPGYAEKEKLRDFIYWHLTRTYDVARRAKKHSWLCSPKQDATLAAFVKYYVERN